MVGESPFATAAEAANEEWRERTRWTKGGETVTIDEVLEYLGTQVPSNLNVAELAQILKKRPKADPDRVAAADLSYPIIMLKQNGSFKYILDGNQRFQKALDAKAETISALILDISQPGVPLKFVRVLAR